MRCAQFSGDTVAVAHGVVFGGVERGPPVVAFYGGEEFSGDPANVFQGAVCGGLVQSGGAGFSVDDAGGEVWRGWWAARHGLAL